MGQEIKGREHNGPIVSVTAITNPVEIDKHLKEVAFHSNQTVLAPIQYLKYEGDGAVSYDADEWIYLMLNVNMLVKKGFMEYMKNSSNNPHQFVGFVPTEDVNWIEIHMILQMK